MFRGKSFISFSIGIALFFSPPALAQSQVRVWNSFAINAPLSKNLSAKVGYMKSLRWEENIPQTNFNWYILKVNYELSKSWDMSIGSAWMNIPSADRTTFRLMAEGTHSQKISRKLNLKNSLQAERHNKQESRFDYRLIYSSRLGFRKRLDFLGVAPSLTYSLFFNFGGTPLKYFNANQEQIALKPANGLHRGRATANFNFKISNPLRLSIFYTNQHEFNLVFSETNKINVTNPISGKIQTPFSNQHIVGFLLSYQLQSLMDEPILPQIF
ncbi:DUF2490 domain-containing protein [Algoriphagus sanaruensis]|uniref:Outer membrane protein beta-barrel domain-containing protein n=1 Tax=Algoriphagus sanaruensis TaxID=1727163 RepID=A0A142EQ86_9BACT|nr:DUF2490 domain-containing protein [Algoriphagus sanaruensis]AMQ57291.1 hypothetical protein AO498_12660 [Algoriphagus sanaruensis]